MTRWHRYENTLWLADDSFYEPPAIRSRYRRSVFWRIFALLAILAVVSGGLMGLNH